MRMVVLGVLVLVAGCKDKQCRSSSSNVTPGGVAYHWSECSDGSDRTLTCDVQLNKFACTCTKDGKPGATFELPSTGMVKSDLVTPEMAKERCGWAFAP